MNNNDNLPQKKSIKQLSKLIKGLTIMTAALSSTPAISAEDNTSLTVEPVLCPGIGDCPTEPRFKDD